MGKPVMKRHWPGRMVLFVWACFPLLTDAMTAPEAPAAWQTEFIDLAVELDPLHGSLRGDARLLLKHPGSGDDAVSLELNHQLQVESVTDETGRPLVFRQSGDSLSVLPQKRAAATPLRVIRLRYRGSFFERIPELNMRNAWIGPQVSFAFHSSRWYPQSPEPFRGSRGNISYLVPADWTVASTGKLAATETPPGAKRCVFAVHSPSEFSFAAAAFVHRRQQLNGLEFNIFLLKGDQNKIDFYMQRCMQVIAFFREFYGSFPYDAYSMVEIYPDLLGQAGAGSYGNLTFFPTQILPERFFYAPVFAHEISHCWWGSCVRGVEGPVINEGLAQISMGVYLEHVMGSTFYWDLLKNGAPKYLVLHSARLFFRNLQLPKIKGTSLEALLMRGEDLELGLPAKDKFTTLHMLSSSKGFFVFAMLREWIGAEAFRQGLRSAQADFAWKAMSLDDLRRTFEEASGTDLQWFFEQWFRRKGAPEFAIDCWFAQRSKFWLVQVMVSQLRDVYRVRAEIAFKRGLFREIRTIEITAKETKFSFLLPFRPQSVSFDPDYKILRWSDQF
jgi:aminopeptidase N